MKKNLKLLQRAALLREKSKKMGIRVALGSILMCGTALGGTYYVNQQMEAFKPEKFPDEDIVVNKHIVSKKDFYENIKEKDGVWYYTDRNGKDVNLYDATDFRIIADLSYKSLQNVKLKTNIDTVEVKRNNRNKSVMYAYASMDSVKNCPALGLYSYGNIKIRHFMSEDPQLSQKYQIYNDEYNCTLRHEYQHYLNAKAGITRANQSYETKFAECCMDEVSANIAQLLEQRKNYLKTGDINRVTNRFKFYREWLLTQPQPLPEKISKQEQGFIANGVLNEWKETRFKMYENRNLQRVTYYMYKANYNAVVDHPDEHLQLMKDMFNINGINFYQHIKGREKEFSDMLSPENKKECTSLTELKKRKMKYFEKVEQLTQGDKTKKSKYFRALKEKHEWNKFKKVLMNER